MRPPNIRALAVDHLGDDVYNDLKRDLVLRLLRRLGFGLPGSPMERLDNKGYDFHGSEKSWAYTHMGQIQRGFTSLEDAVKTAFNKEFKSPPPILRLSKREILPVVGMNKHTFRLTITVSSCQHFNTQGAAVHQANICLEQMGVEVNDGQ